MRLNLAGLCAVFFCWSVFLWRDCQFRAVIDSANVINGHPSSQASAVPVTKIASSIRTYWLVFDLRVSHLADASFDTA